MVKLFVVRHAESTWNPEGRYQGLLDPELSQRGLQQARLLAEALRNVPFDVIYSSPLRRTYLTALEIAKGRDVHVVKDERIREIDHGVWSGLTVEEVKRRFPETFRMWMEEPHRTSFEGGESLTDVYRRVADFVEEIKRKHQHQTVAVVSHTVPIRAMYCYLLGVDLSRFWSFGCDNASYSVIHLEENRNVIQKLNITCHLGEYYVEAHSAL
ncbi:Phosphoglycerate mutase [Thermocrinis albus DSM 14484]|uniref:Phosphoglycerate mutase n=1 Tax=Thermocrinis albus (strain DSM 14484 / JCM 11386 / HI 11/12) TaxID=638303 RepID=D3SL81_THEAH|nr:histidine phosphatase family protein [Thermocrinis albus]ADC89511.1 Phosphoglycerate mutase [Thermocrinis albus DSM 14484]